MGVCAHVWGCVGFHMITRLSPYMCSEQCRCQVGRVKRVEVHCTVEAMAERRRRKRSREEERRGRAGR